MFNGWQSIRRTGNPENHSLQRSAGRQAFSFSAVDPQISVPKSCHDRRHSPQEPEWKRTKNLSICPRNKT
jgi:hypothetical protein